MPLVRPSGFLMFSVFLCISPSDGQTLTVNSESCRSHSLVVLFLLLTLPFLPFHPGVRHSCSLQWLAWLSFQIALKSAEADPLPQISTQSSAVLVVWACYSAPAASMHGSQMSVHLGRPFVANSSGDRRRVTQICGLMLDWDGNTHTFLHATLKALTEIMKLQTYIQTSFGNSFPSRSLFHRQATNCPLSTVTKCPI